MRLELRVALPASGAKPESGIALVIVMISIFVLSILAGGFAYSMKVETKLARNANSESELEWMGRSTVEYCRWVLAQQLNIPQEPYDALNQVWAGGSGGMGVSNSALANVQTTLTFRKGTATWKIVDLERKININMMLNNEGVLQQALMVAGVDAGEMTMVANSILDWMDRDDNTRVEGAESDFYQNDQGHPYFAKNGPIDDLSELLLVRGVSPELYWGSASPEHPPSSFLPRLNRAGLPVEGPVYPVGLVELFTPLSTGKVNINTASANVLTVLLGGDAMAAQKIIEVRSGTGPDGLETPIGSMGFGVADALVSAGMNRQAAGAFANVFSVRSFTFEVTVDAEISGYHRKFIAVLGRNSAKDIQVLNFYWK